MQLSFAFNTILGSALIIALIFADYIRKYTTDRSQKVIFCCILLFSFIPMMSDLTALLLEGMPGRKVYSGLLTVKTIHNFFLVLAYYFFILFVDLIIYKGSGHTKKIIAVISIINIIHIILLFANLKWPFYFYIDSVDNTFHYGKKYYIRLIISYIPLVFGVYEMIASSRLFRRSSLAALFVVMGLTAVVSTATVFWGTVNLLWPCISATILCCYFFIIQSDARLDSLTGIGNRFSFGEFIDRLSRRNSDESWAIVMIDMDHFKQINDTMGHQEGDTALRDMAAIIKGCLKGSDFAARYGGDEFVLATRVDKMGNSVASLMWRIQEEADRLNMTKLRSFKIELSYGYDVFTPGGGRSIDEFMCHIDSLMYKHKERRRRVGDKRDGKI